MSTKIYTAFRTTSDPFTLAAKIKEEGQRQAREKLKEIAVAILSGAAHAEAVMNQEYNRRFLEFLASRGITEPTMKDYLTLRGEFEFPEHLKRTQAPPPIAVLNSEIPGLDEHLLGMKMLEIGHWMEKRYAEQLQSQSRNPWYLDTSVTFRRYVGAYYLIPYCDRVSHVSGCLDFLETLPDVEDYAYWNHTDRPNHVSEKDWDERSATWYHMLDHDRWGHFLTLEVVSYPGFSHVCPSRLALGKESAQALEQDIEASRHKYADLIALAKEIEQ